MQDKSLPHHFIGQKYNKLTVLKYVKTLQGHHYYLCQCECGKTKTINLYTVKKGVTKSCGCICRESHWSKRPVVFQGQTTSLKEIASRFGLTTKILAARKRDGMSLEEAVQFTK